MNLISVSNLTKEQGIKILFKNISFGIDKGEKCALIGLNGSGKTTLLNLLAGADHDGEKSIFSNNQLRISYLKQDYKFDSEQTIFNQIYKGNTKAEQVIKEYCNSSGEKNFHFTDPYVSRYYGEVKEILAALSITNLTEKLGTLSGGMLKKVFLAASLAADSDMLILDEPTNHLDLKTIEWLQNHLQKTKKTLLLVTHDRYFLDKVCLKIFEIDNQQLYSYNGSFSYYLENRELRLAQTDREQNKIQNILRRERVWLSRGPKARGGKQKARKDRATFLESKLINKNENNMEIGVDTKETGKNILTIKNISKTFDQKTIINKFSYTFKNRERIGLIGPNGSGKTTLLNLIMQRLEPDSGHISAGIHTKFGYFDQLGENLDQEMSIHNYFKEFAEIIKMNNGVIKDIAQTLEYFNFPPHMHRRKIKHLSGGERRRLQLVRTILAQPNFLILDEPTNDFDIFTLNMIENFINDFNGSIMAVSHDRYFLDKTMDQLFIFNNNGIITHYSGSYSDYHLDQKKIQKEITNSKKTVKINPDKKEGGVRKGKLSYKEKQEYSTIEGEIETLENEREQLEISFNNLKGNEDFQAMTNQKHRYDELSQIIEKKMERWEYLASKD